MSRGCQHAVEYLYEYLDSELTWSRVMRIRWHLRSCDPCCGAYEFETRLKAVIRERGAEPPPPELFDRLRTFLHEHIEDRES